MLYITESAALKFSASSTALLPLPLPDLDLTVQSETISKPRTPYRGTHAGLFVRPSLSPPLLPHITHTHTPTPLHNTHSLQYYLA